MGRAGEVRVTRALGLLVAFGPDAGLAAATLQVEQDRRVFPIAPHGPGSPRPVMPAIPFLLSGEAVRAGAPAEWTASFSYTTRERHPLHLADRFRASGQGAQVPDLFRHPTAALHPNRGKDRDSLRGGTLTAGVSVPPGAGPATLAGLQVRLGDQPGRTRVAEQLTLGDEVLPDGTQVAGVLLTAWIRAIARHESDLRQNAAAQDPAHFQALGEPLMNRSGDGGIGIMQRTPHGIERHGDGFEVQDWLWDWTANVAEGLRLFRAEKLRGLAYRYPGQVEGSPGFIRAVEATNQAREQAGQARFRRIQVPAFTAEQMVLDAVRGYNGYAGRDPFGLALHEFRLRTRLAGTAQILEVAQEGPDPEAPGQRRAWAVWEPVPAAERPAQVGDPDYVARVRAWLDQPVDG